MTKEPESDTSTPNSKQQDARPAPVDRADETPSGLSAEESSLRRLRPPKTHPAGRQTSASEAEKRPSGLRTDTTTARLRLQLATEYDDDSQERGLDSIRPPTGLNPLTTSARMRLELAPEHDEDEDEEEERAQRRRRERKRRERARQKSKLAGKIPFDGGARASIHSLTRWVTFCGLLTLTVGALTGLGYLTGSGSVANVVVGILASALAVWQLMAALRLRGVARSGERHHLVNGLGLVRSALLLKAILVFCAMALSCFTFSLAAWLLFLP